MSQQPWKLGDIFKISETLAFSWKYPGTPLERGTWAPKFAHSVISGHDRYNAISHPPAQGHIDAETFTLS